MAKNPLTITLVRKAIAKLRKEHKALSKSARTTQAEANRLYSAVSKTYHNIEKAKKIEQAILLLKDVSL